MIQLKKAKGFHSLHSRLTLWVMLTVLAVFVLITIIITNVIRKALLSSSEENAKSRIEIANQHINSILVGVEVAVDNVIPEIMENPSSALPLPLSPTISPRRVSTSPLTPIARSTAPSRQNSWARRNTSTTTWTGIRFPNC